MDGTKHQIEYKRLDEICPYDNNPRRNDEAAKAVANSIKEFGFQSPIIVDRDGVIIAGHTRYKAARRLKLQEVPVIVAAELDPERSKPCASPTTPPAKLPSGTCSFWCRS